MSRSPVLIVSASAGMGHVRAGVALRDAFSAAGVAAEHVDILTLGPRWVRAAYGGGFRLLAGHAPLLWRGIYAMSDGPDDDPARWGPVANRVLFRSFRRLLQSERWSYCVCTHFLPAQLAGGRAGSPPFALAVTDFSLHRYWVQLRVRDYFVATPVLASRIAARVPGASALATGIPIDPAFSRRPSWQAARAELGLDVARPVVLVMGGSFGLGVEAAADAVLDAPTPDAQVVVICGGNEDAKRALDSRTNRRLHVFGMVTHIERFLTAADGVVTKPGGLTTSEALAAGRPLVLTRPIPGHEADNAGFLNQAGAALLADDADSLTREVTRLLTEPALRLSMSAAARTLGRPHAAEDIAAVVARRIDRRAVA